MTREQVAAIVIKALENEMEDFGIEVTEESNVMDDLDLDSIALQGVLSDLEDQFDVEISDSMLRKMIYVKDVIDLLVKLQEK